MTVFSRSTDRPVIMCEDKFCHSQAILLAGGYSYCREHYDNYFHTKALIWNKANGLDTVDHRKEFISNKIRGVISAKTI